jgi:hypothetical protein
MLVVPQLWLQKHADTRAHDFAHSTDLWYSLGLVTLPAPEAGDSLELILLYAWRTRYRDCACSKCILRFYNCFLSLASSMVLTVGQTTSECRSIMCDSNYYYNSRTGPYVGRGSSDSIGVRPRDERPSNHGLIPDRSKMSCTYSSRPDRLWSATSLLLNGFWGLFPSG